MKTKNHTPNIILWVTVLACVVFLLLAAQRGWAYPKAPDIAYPYAADTSEIAKAIEKAIKEASEGNDKEAPNTEYSRCVRYPTIQGPFKAVCMECHTMPDLKIKEIDPHMWREYPNSDTLILYDKETGEPYGRYKSSSVYSKSVFDALQYFQQNNIKKIIVELHNPGGNIFEGWRIFGLLSSYDGHIITRCHGIAASAGFIIWLAGDERECTPRAVLMAHELWQFKMFDFSTPSSKEQEATEMRYLQDNASDLIAERCTLTKEEVDERIKNKNWWITGRDAYEFGFATRLLE